MLLLLPVLGLVPVDAAAQSGARGGDELTREQMLERIHAQYERQLQIRLGVDAETRDEIQKILHSMRTERRALYQRKRALHRQREAFADDGGSEAQAREILAEARALRAEEARIAAEEEARLLEFLTPRQVLEFQILREEFNERVRRVYRRGDPGDSAKDDSLF